MDANLKQDTKPEAETPKETAPAGDKAGLSSGTIKNIQDFDPDQLETEIARAEKTKAEAIDQATAALKGGKTEESDLAMKSAQEADQEASQLRIQRMRQQAQAEKMAEQPQEPPKSPAPEPQENPPAQDSPPGQPAPIIAGELGNAKYIETHVETPEKEVYSHGGPERGE